MAKIEICEEDLIRLDERIAREIFGLEKRREQANVWKLVVEQAGWYKPRAKQSEYNLSMLPKYSQDLNEAIKVARMVASNKQVGFSLEFDAISENLWKIIFFFKEHAEIKTPIMTGREEDEDNLAFRICSISLSFQKNFLDRVK
ncbi:MAG: hypothetical protein Q8N55_04095 [bacterium]|nr:hypothetical protein [bacterium]